MAIVVPIYNEAASAKQACQRLIEVARRYQGQAVVIAVDDGSNDGSGSMLDELAAECDLLVCEHHLSNRGYGVAGRTGAVWALDSEYDFVAFIDSDLTNPPEDLLKIGELAKAGALYVKGSRFTEGGGMKNVPFRRSVFTRTGNLVGSWLFGTGFADVTNGFRAAQTDLYCSWPLKEAGFAVIMEEIYWATAQAVRIVSFPTVLQSREEHQRASSFAYTPRVMWDYLRYPLRTFAGRVLSRFRGSRVNSSSSHGVNR